VVTMSCMSSWLTRGKCFDDGHPVRRWLLRRLAALALAALALAAPALAALALAAPALAALALAALALAACLGCESGIVDCREAAA
jgi:hypothetical protein